MDVVILAGGMGTRLRPVVQDIPKPMASIDGLPFLSFLFNYLTDYHVERAVLSVGYQHQTIQTFFSKRYSNIQIEYAVEDTPLGTGGAVKHAVQAIEGDSFYLMNGDTFFDVDLDAMAKAHQLFDNDITIAVRFTGDAGRYGTVQLDDTRVTGFSEKQQASSGYINGGVYIINRRAFDAIRETSFSLEKDVLEKHAKDLKIGAFKSDGYFIDIGIPEDYKRAQKELPKRIGSLR